MLTIQHRLGANAKLGPKTEAAIAAIVAEFESRLVGTPTPKDGDAVILHGKNKTYSEAHLEWKGYICNGRDELAYCTQVYKSPHIHTAGHPSLGNRRPPLTTSASGGYWGSVKCSDLRHVGVVEKWFWIWGEWGPGADAGVYLCVNVNQWEYTCGDIY